MPGCPDADLLAALISGTLPETTRTEIANHASGCDSCFVVIETLVSGGRVPREREPTIVAGSQIGRYVIEERIGAGGMGVVFAATDSELRRKVAIKILRRDHVEDATADERLMREARVLARLSHPNVVTVFDVGVHDGHHFVAMELVEGGSLSAWLAGGRRSERDIIERMLEAGRGLAAAHSAGVVHRDVKPDNILVGIDGRTRVTDFGLAHGGSLVVPDGVLDPSLTHTGTVLGTPAYMGPEQLGRETTALTDQWSYCTTFYEALAGVRPFPASDRDARIAAIAARRLAAPVDGHRVPSWVRQILIRGLEADPAARWPSMDSLLEAFARHRTRTRVLAMAAGASLIVGASIGVARLVASDPTTPPEKPLTFIDQRPGCNCPLSTCKTTCDSVCRASSFEIGAKLPGVSQDGRQEALLGAAGDGNTLLYLAGERCSLDHLFVARRRGATFESVDVTSQIDRARFGIFEGCCTLGPDGETIVLSSADHTSFALAKLVGPTIVPGAELRGILPVAAAGSTLRHPVLSRDGLTMYFRLDQPAEPNDVGPADGIYYVERRDRGAAFANPRRVGRSRPYDYVTGMSSDGLTLFLASEFETHVLVRPTRQQPFDNLAWSVPARVAGWRGVPLDDCNHIITTITPGGCAAEDISYLDAVFTH